MKRSRVVSGNILLDNADVLVCPVNSVGICGAGLAYEFGAHFQGLTHIHRNLCRHHIVKPGGVYPILADGHRIWLAATKDHWRHHSQLKWIEDILRYIVKEFPEQYPEGVIALPALGCGLGGLSWVHFRELALHELRDVNARIYEPMKKII